MMDRLSPEEAAGVVHGAHDKVLELSAQVRADLEHLSVNADPILARARERVAKFCRSTGFPLADTAAEAAAAFTGMILVTRIGLSLGHASASEEDLATYVEQFRGFLAPDYPRTMRRRWKGLVKATVRDVDDTVSRWEETR